MPVLEASAGHQEPMDLGAVSTVRYSFPNGHTVVLNALNSAASWFHCQFIGGGSNCGGFCGCRRAGVDAEMDLLRSKKPWLRISDLAKEFGISRSTAYEWAAAGAFGVPVQPAGPSTALLFSRSQVEKALRDSQERLSARTGYSFGLKNLSGLSGGVRPVLRDSRTWMV